MNRTWALPWFHYGRLIWPGFTIVLPICKEDHTHCPTTIQIACLGKIQIMKLTRLPERAWQGLKSGGQRPVGYLAILTPLRSTILSPETSLEAAALTSQLGRGRMYHVRIHSDAKQELKRISWRPCSDESPLFD